MGLSNSHSPRPAVAAAADTERVDGLDAGLLLMRVHSALLIPVFQEAISALY